MALTGTGANLAYKDNGAGRLTIDWGADGNPKFNDDQADLVMSLLFESPWFGDRAGKRRSLIATIDSKDPSTPGRLEQYALDALQPAIDDGRLRSVNASARPIGNGYSLTVTYITRTGRPGSQSVALSG